MIYVTGHSYPTSDLDSIASSILFSNFIKEYYRLEAKPIFLGKKDRYLENILYKLKIEFPKKYKIKKDDLFVLVDHNDLEQSLDHYNIKNKILGIVDHHPDVHQDYIKFKIIKKYGSTATIIYEMYKKYKVNITKKLANLFVYAVISDTINLKIDMVSNKDRDLIDELYSKYKLRSRDKIFKTLFNLKKQNNKKIKELINENLKIFKIKKYEIYVSEIVIGNSFNRYNDVKEYVEKQKLGDLYCCVFSNLDNNSSKIFYSGRLAYLFKDKEYNKLISRKSKIYPHLIKKLGSL